MAECKQKPCKYVSIGLLRSADCANMTFSHADIINGVDIRNLITKYLMSYGIAI